MLKPIVYQPAANDQLDMLFNDNYIIALTKPMNPNGFYRPK